MSVLTAFITPEIKAPYSHLPSKTVDSLTALHITKMVARD
jgi:hypothetical protein